MDLAKEIRDIVDFPKPGIVFKDITTLLQKPAALKEALEKMYALVKDLKIDVVAGIESRGFIFGTHLAYTLGVGFVPIRKPGKLPSETIAAEYDLEYGKDKIEIHKDAVRPGQKVLIVDDLLATGGTSGAAVKLIKSIGAEVVALLFLVELSFLSGRAKLAGTKVLSLITY